MRALIRNEQHYRCCGWTMQGDQAVYRDAYMTESLHPTVGENYFLN